MSYAQSGLIEITDYNNLIGTSPSSTTNRINTVWAVGSGNAGYGQTAISAVVTQTTVTATQWASLINTLNSILTHQSGSGSGISAVTAGSTITYLSTLQTNVNTAYTNRQNFASNSSVTVGSALTASWTSATTSATLTRGFGARATFASADQARYFFNAGGRLKYNISGAQNASTTGRTNEIIAQAGFLGGVGLFAANTNGGRTGTGGTLGTNDTAKGYWQTTTANVVIVQVTSTTANYTSDISNIAIKTNGLQGSNNDNGTTIDFWTVINSSSGNPLYSFDDAIGVTITQSIDISYPETTNLSNTWGTVTISQL
jgi:hypothetical protein